jgi:hypothetical protein
LRQETLRYGCEKQGITVSGLGGEHSAGAGEHLVEAMLA